MQIEDLKCEIQKQMGIPSSMQNMIHSGKSLQENLTLQDDGIASDMAIILNARILIGNSGSSSKGPGSFKDAVKGKVESQTKLDLIPNIFGPYIVEHMSQVPALTVTLDEANELYVEFHT